MPKSIAVSLRRMLFAYKLRTSQLTFFLTLCCECEAEMLCSGNFIDDDSAVTVILDDALP